MLRVVSQSFNKFTTPNFSELQSKSLIKNHEPVSDISNDGDYACDLHRGPSIRLHRRLQYTIKILQCRSRRGHVAEQFKDLRNLRSEQLRPKFYQIQGSELRQKRRCPQLCRGLELVQV